MPSASKCLLTTVSRGLTGQCGQVSFNRQLLAVSRHHVDNMGYCFLGVHITHIKEKGKSGGQKAGAFVVNVDMWTSPFSAVVTLQVIILIYILFNFIE